MGVLEIATAVGAVATLITSAIALGIKLWRDAEAKKAQKRADVLRELALKLEHAKTDEERIEYANKLAELHRNL